MWREREESRDSPERRPLGTHKGIKDLGGRGSAVLVLRLR